MNAINEFKNAQLQIVPGRNARFAPPPPDWYNYGVNPAQVLILDKAVTDAISAHRAHEESQRRHVAADERRSITVFRRKGRWTSGKVQMSFLLREKIMFFIRETIDGYIIKLDLFNEALFLIAYENAPILIPTVKSARQFAYDCYPTPPSELQMMQWKPWHHFAS
jgi:hypothetical protein